MGKGGKLAEGSMRASLGAVPPPERIKWRWAALVFLFYMGVGSLVYSNSFRADFHLDDYKSIGNVSGPVSLSGLWNNPSGSKRRVLVDLTLALNFQYGGWQVAGYHAVNLFIHIMAAFFAFLLAALTFKTPVLRHGHSASSQTAAAFFVGLVFLCHPVQTESVTYICQRYASLSGLFYLAGLTFYAAYQLWRNKISAFLAVAAGAAGFFTKENFFTFPFAVLLYDLCFFRVSSAKDLWVPKRKTWGVFFALAVVAFFVSQADSTILAYGQKLRYHLSRSDYLMTQFGVLVRYIALLFVPVQQNFHWDILIQRTFFSWAVIKPLLAVLAFLALGCYFFIKRKSMVIVFAIFWFFLTLIVESSVFPLEDLMVEHRLYLTVFGYALFLVFLIFKAVPSRRKYLYLCLCVVLLGFMAYQRNFVYLTHRTLWADAASKSPNKYRPWSQLALDARASKNNAAAFTYAVKTLEVLSANYEKDPLYLQGLAIKDYEQITSILLETYAQRTGGADFDELVDGLYSIQRELNATTAEHVAGYRRKQHEAYELDKDYSNIAIGLEKRGQSDQAEKLFKKAIEINPKNAANHSNYGVFLLTHSRYQEARAEIERALELDPDFEDAKKNLAALSARMEPSQGASPVLEASGQKGSTGQVRELTPEEKELTHIRKTGEQFRQTQDLRQLQKLAALRRIPKRI